MVSFLKKMREVGQPLSTSIVQPIFKGMIQSIVSEFIKLSQDNGLDNSWNNTCVGLIVWQPLLQANFQSPPLGIRSNFSFMVVHNKCWWNVVCFHQISNLISYGVALNKTIFRELGSHKEIKTCVNVKFGK